MCLIYVTLICSHEHGGERFSQAQSSKTHRDTIIKPSAGEDCRPRYTTKPLSSYSSTTYANKILWVVLLFAIQLNP